MGDDLAEPGKGAARAEALRKRRQERSPDDRKKPADREARAARARSEREHRELDEQRAMVADSRGKVRVSTGLLILIASAMVPLVAYVFVGRKFTVSDTDVMICGASALGAIVGLVFVVRGARAS